MYALSGVLVIAAAIASPLHERAEATLSAHMFQHLLLVVVAAPLLAIARPGYAVRRLPRRARRVLGRWGRAWWGLCRQARPTVAAVAIWCIHIGALWLWHVPLLYEAAIGRPWLHAVEHASLLGTAWLFWTFVVPPRRSRLLGEGGLTLYLFGAAVQCSVLGALITFAETPWYAAQAHGAGVGGLGPLEDQQLAGLLMWFPGGMVYGVVAVWVLGARLRRAERRPDGPALGRVRAGPCA